MQETSDSSSGTEYKMLDTQSSSATAEDIIVLFKNKLRKEGFVTHEIEYMTRSGAGFFSWSTCLPCGRGGV